MFPAANEPVPSRFTMAFAVSALVGARIQFNASVPLEVIGEPFTVKSELGALRATLVTVPVPGNCCPEAKVIWPLLAIFRPVSARVLEPEP
jgi:hypothetical protein